MGCHHPASIVRVRSILWPIASHSDILYREMENKQLTLLDLDQILAHGDVGAGRRFRYLYWIPYSDFINVAIEYVTASIS